VCGAAKIDLRNAETEAICSFRPLLASIASFVIAADD
jgi:hypothetical protein